MDGQDGFQATGNLPEIDTRAPFRSVKEAVSLFGDKVLAGELYLHNNLKQMNVKGATHGNKHNTPKPDMTEPATTELEQTKQSLKKAKEETKVMATNLSSLQQELERTKRELNQLKKDQQSDKHVLLVNSDNYIELKAPETLTLSENIEFQKKRYVTFADPLLPTIIKSPRRQVDGEGVFLMRHPSLKKKEKKKKKPLIPLIGAMFSKKKGTQHQHHQQNISA